MKKNNVTFDNAYKMLGEDTKFALIRRPGKFKFYVAAYYGDIYEGGYVMVESFKGKKSVFIVDEKDVLPGGNKTINYTILGTCDITDYTRHVEKTKRLKFIEEQMDARMDLLQKKAYYEHLSGCDSVMKSLYDEFKVLKGYKFDETDR